MERDVQKRRGRVLWDIVGSGGNVGPTVGQKGAAVAAVSLIAGDGAVAHHGVVEQ